MSQSSQDKHNNEICTDYAHPNLLPQSYANQLRSPQVPEPNQQFLLNFLGPSDSDIEIYELSPAPHSGYLMRKPRRFRCPGAWGSSRRFRGKQVCRGWRLGSWWIRASCWLWRRWMGVDFCSVGEYRLHPLWMWSSRAHLHWWMLLRSRLRVEVICMVADLDGLGRLVSSGKCLA